MISILDIMLSLTAFVLGMSVGAFIVIYRLYVTTRSTVIKIIHSFIDKIHGVDVDFEDVWSKIKPVIDRWFDERNENE